MMATSSISSFGQKLKKSVSRKGFDIIIPAQPISENERLLAMIFGFAYSVLGFGFGIYSMYKGAQLFECGVIEGHGSWKGVGIQFQDLAPGTLLFIIGALCFKISAFTVRSGGSDTTEPVISTSTSRLEEKLKKAFSRSGFEIIIPAHPMSERERLLAMILGFAYSVLGCGFGIYCLYKGVELFEYGVVEGHGSWTGIGIQFQDLAPGALLFIIGGLCFKTSAFTVRTGDSDTTEPVSESPNAS
jgi:hypothetical protein